MNKVKKAFEHMVLLIDSGVDYSDAFDRSMFKFDLSECQVVRLKEMYDQQ